LSSKRHRAPAFAKATAGKEGLKERSEGEKRRMGDKGIIRLQDCKTARPQDIIL
jgi:hypothetical protein